MYGKRFAEHSEALLFLGLFSPDALRHRVQDLSYGPATGCCGAVRVG
ncbi:hypothetical protein ACWC24_22335 [Streptomyces sp. NPDC001443]